MAKPSALKGCAIALAIYAFVVLAGMCAAQKELNVIERVVPDGTAVAR